MQTILNVPLPQFARWGWTGRGRTRTGEFAYRAPSRVAYLAALLAMGRNWE